MIRFRDHRGTLADSIRTTQDFESVDALAIHIAEAIGFPVAATDLEFAPFGDDSRIGWFNQRVVIIKNLGVAGFALFLPQAGN